MSQATLSTPGSPLAMAALATFLDNALAALASVQRGDPSAITNPTEGMLCWDSTGTPDALKRYTVAAGWKSILKVNKTTGAVTIQDLTLTAAAIGFTIAGGTTSRTLTVDETKSLSDKANLSPLAIGYTIAGGTSSRTLTVDETKSLSDKANASDVALINKIWTYQNTAPSGWSIVAGTTDAILACKGGSQEYNANGGQQKGTWTQPNHHHTGGSHALTIAELAEHTHTRPTCVLGVQSGGGSNSGTVYSAGAFTSYQAAKVGSSTGSGTAHSHGATSDSGTAATYRPLANLGIIIERT